MEKQTLRFQTEKNMLRFTSQRKPKLGVCSQPQHKKYFTQEMWSSLMKFTLKATQQRGTAVLQPKVPKRINLNKTWVRPVFSFRKVYAYEEKAKRNQVRETPAIFSIIHCQN